MEHVEKEDLVAFFFSSPNRALHARVAHHLLGGCFVCHELAKEVLGLTNSPRVEASRQELTVFLRQSALLRDEMAKAPVNWARIASLGEDERINLMKRRWRFKKYGLASYVLDEAEALVARDKRERAKELVRFSAAVANCLSQRVYGGSPIADLRLRQATVVANILRIDLDFAGSLSALVDAERARNEGLDLGEKARFYRVQAMLLFDLGDFEEAAKAAREAVLLYEAMYEPHSKAKALLQEAMILAHFQPRAGLSRAEEGLAALISPDYKTFLLGLFIKAFSLIRLGQAEEANSFLSMHWALIREVSDTGSELWFRYLEGMILHSQGKTNDAEAVLSYVAHRFREEGLIKEMLFQHLERIRIKVETGRWKSALRIATRLTPELARLGLRNDLLALWASLQDALSQRRNTIFEIEGLLLRRWNTPVVVGARQGGFKQRA